MTVLPAPVDLTGPPGSAGLLLATVEGLTAAAYNAGTVTHLMEPASVLHGWQGADAAVAGAEVASATSVAEELHAALSTALRRLSAHADTWQLVERRIAELRRQQEVQFEAVRPLVASTTGMPPTAAALVQELTAEESARAAEHRALLAELADDADRTAAVLGQAGGHFGGIGQRGDAIRVQLHLAAVLPGWGTGLMAGRGAGAARELTGRGTAADLEAAALRYAPYARVPAFADALLAGLGADGVGYLLDSLAATTGPGGGGADEPAPLAVLLAGAFTAAGADDPRLADVTGPAGAGRLLDARDADAGVDAVAVAMGLVLAVPGAGPGLAASWGRALLERERTQGAGAVARTTPTADDPVVAAVAVLARAGDAGASAELLASPDAWVAALARPWPDGGAALAEVIGLATAAPGGGSVGRAALTALGEGLQPGTDRTVTGDPETLATVRGAIGGLVAAQVGEVVVAVLGPVAAGELPDPATDAGLRGLARLLLEPGQQDVLAGALADALQAVPAAEAAAVAGGFVAVQEYAERVRHALACAQGLVDAVEWQVTFDVLVRMPVALVTELAPRMSPLAEALTGAAVDGLAVALDAEGEYAPPADTGVVRTADDAARSGALAGTGAGGAGVVTGAAALEAAARAGFTRTAAVLGVPPIAAASISLQDRFEPPEPEQEARRRDRSRRGR